jgi:hypothetical protein
VRAYRRAWRTVRSRGNLVVRADNGAPTADPGTSIHRHASRVKTPRVAPSRGLPAPGRVYVIRPLRPRQRSGAILGGDEDSDGVARPVPSSGGVPGRSAYTGPQSERERDAHRPPVGGGRSRPQLTSSPQRHHQNPGRPRQFPRAGRHRWKLWIALPPGRYRVTGLSPLYNGGRTTCFATSAATVRAGATTVADVSCQLK